MPVHTRPAPDLTRQKCRRSIIPLLVIVFLICSWASAFGTVITVTNGNDAGPGSLREAITNANPGDEIIFDPSVTSITLTSGELLLDKDLTIKGDPGQTVEINPNLTSGIFEIQSGARVQLSYLRMAKGLAPYGGGIYVLDSTSTVNVDNCEIWSNMASDLGGGIKNMGTLTLTNSTLYGNTAGAFGGGIYNEGTATLQIDRSTISYNQAGNGSGGGICEMGAGLTILNSTISHNTAAGSPGNGGGIYVYSSATTVNLNSSTVAFNTAANLGGGVKSSIGLVNLNNSIISNNSAVNAGNDLYCDDIDCSINSNDYNLILDNTGFTLSGNAGNNIYGQDPALQTLGDNGGPTQTHALLSSSPAVDAGDPSLVDDGTRQHIDQREVNREQDGNDDGIRRSDIGAFELTHFRLTVDTTAGTGTGKVTSADGNISCPDACSHDYNNAFGQIVNLTATPDADSEFVCWSGACAQGGTDPEVTLYMWGDLQCTAEFTLAGSRPNTQTVSFTGGTTTADYVMFTIGVALQNGVLLPIEVYDPVMMRIGLWFAPENNYLEYPFTGYIDTSDVSPPGIALWGLFREDTTLTLVGEEHQLEPPPTDLGGDAGLWNDFINTGWNQVGNPYNYPIPLSGVRLSDSSRQAAETVQFYVWSGEGYEVIAAGGALAAYQAGWIKAPAGKSLLFFQKTPASTAACGMTRTLTDAEEQPPPPPQAWDDFQSTSDGSSGCYINAAQP